jgi:hypothetical protein
MSTRQPLCTVYQVRCDLCEIMTDTGPAEASFSARWVEERRDSEEVREEIVRAIAERIGAVALGRHDVEFGVEALAPRSGAGETEMRVELGLPATRAKVILEIQLVRGDTAELDQCSVFEKGLHACLQKLDRGSWKGPRSAVGFIEWFATAQGRRGWSRRSSGPRAMRICLRGS